MSTDQEKAKILIVDDHRGARETLKGFLVPENYDLIFAASGQEALTYLEDISPDAILLDVMMPDMDGFEVCERIKANKKWQHIPIILVTALDSKEDLAHGLEVGADDFLHKPVSALELRARVRSMLRIKQRFDDQQTMMKLREDLASMIVHDMRVPLTSILGFSELLLLKGESQTDCTEFVQHIFNEGNRLNSFLNDMLILAKMEHGQLILNCSMVDINQFVQELVQHHHIVAQSKKITLKLELPTESKQVSLDANLFQRVVDNLITNALKFAPSESTVTIQIDYPPTIDLAIDQSPQLHLRVLDEGPGVPSEYRDEIFDKYSIVNLKNKEVSQIGLGLTFTKMVLDVHGGRVFVEDNQPNGAIFTIEV